MSFMVEEELKKAEKLLKEAEKRGEKIYIDLPPEVQKQMRKELKRSKSKLTIQKGDYIEGESCYMVLRELGKAIYVRRFADFDKLVMYLKEEFSKGVSEKEITLVK